MEEENCLYIQTTSTETTNIETAEKKIKRNQFTWVEDSKWGSLEEVEDFLDTNGFVVFDDRDLKSGQKFYFRCMRIPKDRKRTEWCSKRYVVFLPSNSNEIILQTNCCEHNHNDLLKGKKRPISSEMMEFINQLYKLETTKTNQVLLHIQAARNKQNLFQDEPDPTRRQLEYCIKKYRSGSTGQMIHLGDLMNWCKIRTGYPDHGDDAFVLSYQCCTEKDKKSFNFCLTTPNLLKKLSKMTTICIDATYKLNWLGFPLIILGTVDRMKRFHPLIYACFSNETTQDYKFIFQSIKDGIATHYPNAEFAPKKLIADGADAIRNAYYDVYNDCAEIDIMCFAHVIRNVRKRPFASKNSKSLIIDDIRKMQLAPHRKAFDLMVEMFKEKWEYIEPNFIQYFQKEWLGAHVNWFEGAAVYTPSTNNALESHNATIKKKVTFRRKLPLGEFLIAMKLMTSKISKEFSEGKRCIATEPNIVRATMLRAAEMHDNGFTAFKATSKVTGRLVYVLPAQKCPEENRNYNYYKTLKNRKWSSFDEFISYGYQMFWQINFSYDQWNTQSTCTCPAFFKQHICKHIIAVALKEGTIQCPETANPMLLAAKKRTAGRPKNAGKSLLRE